MILINTVNHYTVKEKKEKGNSLVLTWLYLVLQRINHGRR
jgi:hypothetical protein